MVDKFVYIADGNSYVFFNVENPNGNYMGNKGLYVMAEKDMDLENVEKLNISDNRVDVEGLKEKVILYFETNEKELWRLLRFVRLDRPGIEKQKALSILQEEFIYSTDLIEVRPGLTIQVIEAKERVPHSGYRFTAFEFPRGRLEVMIQTSFILGIEIRNKPHFLIHKSYAGTGEHGYILYKLENQEFISQFEEWGFST